MKIRTYILAILTATSGAAFGQITDYKILEKEAEAAKCYEMSNLDSTSTDSMYLELVPPVFEAEYKTLDEIKIELPNSWYESNGKGLLLKRSASKKFIKYKKRRTQNDDLMCLVEIPAYYHDVSKNVVNEEGQPEFDGSKKYKVSIEKSPARIQEVTAAQALASKNPILKIPKHVQWREYLGSGCGHSNIRVKDIQKALNENDVSCKVTGIFDKETKDALFEFQKKNGLSVGRLDIETMKALGF